MSRDLWIALVLALGFHAAILYYSKSDITEVKYDIVKTTSAVEVAIVKTVKQKAPVVEEPVVKKTEKKPIKKKLVKKKKSKKKVKKPKEPAYTPPAAKEVAVKQEREIKAKPAPKKELQTSPKITTEAAPDYLRNKPPDYPLIARRQEYEGVVLLRVEVLPDGNPSTVEIKKSSGYSILDKAAYKAVTKWKFKPAMRGDKPVRSWVVIPVRFNLK